MSRSSGPGVYARLLLTLLLASALHLWLLLGVPSGKPLAPALPVPPLQVSLVPLNPEPEAAAADTNTAPPPSPVAQPPVPPPPTPAYPADPPAATVKPVTPPTEAVTQPATAAPKPSKPEPKPAPKATPTLAPAPSGSLLARSLDMARHSDLSSFTDSSAPRVRRVSGNRSGGVSEEQSYLQHWRDKVQRTGALNYPDAARRQKLSGSLRLLVALRSDGSLAHAEVLTSSGQPLLDQAALDIVRLAAPFRPFPVEMRKNTDLLEIIRVWKFENNTVLY